MSIETSTKASPSTVFDISRIVFLEGRRKGCRRKKESSAASKVAIDLLAASSRLGTRSFSVSAKEKQVSTVSSRDSRKTGIDFLESRRTRGQRKKELIAASRVATGVLGTTTKARSSSFTSPATSLSDSAGYSDYSSSLESEEGMSYGRKRFRETSKRLPSLSESDQESAERAPKRRISSKRRVDFYEIASKDMSSEFSCSEEDSTLETMPESDFDSLTERQSSTSIASALSAHRVKGGSLCKEPSSMSLEFPLVDRASDSITAHLPVPLVFTSTALPTLTPIKKEKTAGSALLAEAASAHPPLKPGVPFWSPDSRDKIGRKLAGISPGMYRDSFLRASVTVEERGIQVPYESALAALDAYGIEWKELVNHLISYAPHQVIFRRFEAKAAVLSLAQEESDSPKSADSGESSEEIPRALSMLRKSHLAKPDTSPCKAYWSPPKAGIFTRFGDFIRERFGITYGRNVSIALAKDPSSRQIIYTVASTAGPPGGTHAELLAWDLLPDSIKELRRGIIFTERQPCCSGSNCNAKLKEALPEIAVIYTQPFSSITRSFIDRGVLEGIVFGIPDPS